MAVERINDEAFRKHSQQLMESAGILNKLGEEFAATIEQASTQGIKTGGSATTKWKTFGHQAVEATNDMKTSLSDMNRKIEDIATVVRDTSTKQEEAVNRTMASSDLGVVNSLFRYNG